MLPSDASVRLAREAFLKDGAPPPPGVVRDEVTASWRRCRQLGLRPDALTDELAGASPAARPEDSGGASVRFGGDWMERFARMLESMNALLVILLEDGTVFQTVGSPALRKTFAAHIAPRAVLTEEYFGTSAISLNRGVGTESRCIGAEHYLDILQGHATFACWSTEEFSRYMFCLVMPEDVFSESVRVMMHYFQETKALSVELYRARSDLAKQRELFNQVRDLHDCPLLFIDFSRKILSVNRHCETLFGLSADDVNGRDLTEIFPELEFVTSSLLSGKAISLTEVRFEGLPAAKKHMYASGFPWKNSKVINGMIIRLHSGKNAETARRRGAGRERRGFDDLVGDSAVFRETKDMARTIADSNSSVILTGESGTGKEMFAQAIHNESGRREKNFVAVNCSAIPKELIGSELFGYGDGAFTGARKGGSEGKFEFAHGGTLFLDEVAELPLETQAILLRVLEEKAVVRLGTNVPIPVDARIISATNKNLLAMVQEGSFRLDLYYRLNVITIELPPLRKRREDIPLLVHSFLGSIGEAVGKTVLDVAPDAMERLKEYPWPGNVRQLRNVVERGINMTTSSVLRLEDLPFDLRNRKTGPGLSPGGPDALFGKTPPPRAGKDSAEEHNPPLNYTEWERRKIWELMQKYRGNKSRIAEELGISRCTLYKKLRRYAF